MDDTPEVRQILVDAGRTMAGRFNQAGRYLPTWVAPGSTFVDVMMNLDIIYEAAEISGDRRLADVATAHALTSRRHLVRGDATVIHEGWFDPQTGEFLRADTHQGWRADSSWARGQAWAIYGFARVYARTGDPRFLATSQQIADSYLERAASKLPPNDWEEPRPVVAIEASAACIAAAGLAELADVSGPDGHRYRDAALEVVSLLMAPDCLAFEEEWDGLITHATYHARTCSASTVGDVGDHYFLEAVDDCSREAAVTLIRTSDEARPRTRWRHGPRGRLGRWRQRARSRPGGP